MARNATVCIDGMNSVDQGGFFPHQSRGSRFVRCDLDNLFNFWGTRQGEQQRLDAVPRDENGVPHRLCSSGHYSALRAFNRDSSRKDGYDPYCRECRHAMQQRAKVSAANHKS